MTKCDQQRFNQYDASFNRGKWMHNCCRNWVIFPRCGLRSSVAWNNHQNHLSSPQYENSLCKMGLKIVGWQVQMELSDCGLILHVPLPCQRGRPVWLDSYLRQEMGPLFHAQDEEFLKAVSTQRWQWWKVKQERSAVKVYLTAFWNHQGMRLEEYPLKGVTTTKGTYFDTLCLWEVIKKKHPSKLSRGVILLQMPEPHKAQLITFLLKNVH